MQLSALCLATTAMAYGFFPPYKQDFEDSVNVLKFTGNAGPWSQRRGIGLSLDPPEGCEIDQVIIYHRHGERWPDKIPAQEFKKAWDKIALRKGHFNGKLEFANYWVPYTSPDDSYLALESLSGAYSGLHTGYYSGMNYRPRYGHLLDVEKTTPVFASGSERIVDTARRFIEGFFGYNTTSAALNIIPETNDQGANSLTPHCQNSSIPRTNCKGDPKLPIFKQTAKTWNKRYGTNLNADDILALLEGTAYELNVRGESPWVDAFSSEVWVAYEHYISSGFYCYDGPNSPSAVANGGNFINASRTLLLEGPENLPLSFNFAHDTNIAPAQAFLGLNAAPNFNESRIQADSGYHLSDIMPQGGRLILERHTCRPVVDEDEDLNNDYQDAYQNAFNLTFPLNSTYTNTSATNATNTGATNSSTTNSTQIKADDTKHFVRIIVNEAVVPIDDCQSGPGFSCPLQEFSDYVDHRLEGRNFGEVCNITEGAPKHLNFWWDYNNTDSLNRMNSTIAYQALAVNYLDQII